MFTSLGGPFKSGKLQFTYNWLKIGTVSPKFDKFYLLFKHYSQLLFDVLQRKMENLEFVKGVNFRFTSLLKNISIIYLLIFNRSCEAICISKAFFGIATAGRHHRVSTIHNQHNLFHQSKLGRDETFSYITCTLFSKNLRVIWCTSQHWVHSWDLDQT